MQTSYTITGLSVTQYDVQVAAVNQVGTGNYTATVNGTPTAATVPGAPTSFALTTTGRTITATWAAPSNNGGRAIISYQIAFRVTGTTSWTEQALLATPTSFTLRLFQYSTSYDVRVRAHNGVGYSAWTSVSSISTGSSGTVPGTPVVSATAGSTSIAVSWTSPGGVVTGYTLRWKLTSASVWTEVSRTAAQRSYSLTGLTLGTSYDIQVRAQNANGNGSYSATLTRVTLSSTTPGAPTGLSLSVSQNSITATWAAPASDGGRAITYYDIRYRRTGTSAWSGIESATMSRSYTLSSLLWSQQYDVQVAARNANGRGSFTATQTATTVASTPRPSAPRNFAVELNGATVTYRWMPPSSGGTILDYFLVDGIRVNLIWQPSLNLTLTGTSYSRTLANKTWTNPALSARNASGRGPYTQNTDIYYTTDVKDTEAPSVPQNVVVNGGAGQISLTWDAPTGGGDVDFYSMNYTFNSVSHIFSQISITSGLIPNTSVGGPYYNTARSFTWRNLAPGSYTINLFAENSFGKSANSPDVIVTVT